MLLLATPLAALAADLAVSVTGFPSNDGTLRCGLFPAADGFPTGTAPLRTAVPLAGNANATCVFRDIAPGTWAVSVAHDANNNGELDKTFVGFPRESWAVSNNLPLSLLGPPRYEDAAFTVPPEGARISLRLIQP